MQVYTLTIFLHMVTYIIIIFLPILCTSCSLHCTSSYQVTLISEWQTGLINFSEFLPLLPLHLLNCILNCCPCFKQHFDTMYTYLAFCNLAPPRMFLPLDLLSEYRIQHGAIGPLYLTSSYSTSIFGRGVSGFATDCPCGVWCCGLTTRPLYVGPHFGNRLLSTSSAVGLT